MRKRVVIENAGGKTTGSDRPLDFQGALNVLRRAASDLENLRHFRDFYRRAANRPVGRHRDRDVLSDLAARIAAGELRFADQREARPEVEDLWTGSAIPDEAEPVHERTTPSGIAPPSITLPEPPPAPEIDLDVASMIEALVQAAVDGVPFCEQCAKAQAAQ